MLLVLLLIFYYSCSQRCHPRSLVLATSIDPQAMITPSNNLNLSPIDIPDPRDIAVEEYNY